MVTSGGRRRLTVPFLPFTSARPPPAPSPHPNQQAGLQRLRETKGGGAPPGGAPPPLTTASSAGEPDVYLEKQLEQFEWQLRTLKEALAAGGDPARAQILRRHADEEACALVLSLLDQVAELRRGWGRGDRAAATPLTRLNPQVRTETAADLNVLHEQRSQRAAEGYERSEAALRRSHEDESTRMAETFRAAEDALKVNWVALGSSHCGVHSCALC